MSAHTGTDHSRQQQQQQQRPRSCASFRQAVSPERYKKHASLLHVALPPTPVHCASMNMEDLYRLLRTGHVQAQGIIDTVADPMLVLDAGLTVQNASRAFFETFQVDRDDTIGRPVYELGNGQWDIPELRRLLVEVIPKATAVINFRVDHVFPDLGARTMLVTARTLFHPDRASHTMLVSIVDATERLESEAAKDMLFGELRHRMKNLLAVTQSIARQMPVEGLSAREYRDAFLDRFAGLIEAEDVAFAEEGETGLEQLLDRVFAPYAVDNEAVVIEASAPVELGPRKVMSLGLLLHELATNAAKYGALCTPGGRVTVGWQLEDGNTALRLSWVETGGPVVSAPVRPGYGTRLVHTAVTYSLHGKLELDYAPEGFKAEIIIPLGTPPSD